MRMIEGLHRERLLLKDARGSRIHCKDSLQVQEEVREIIQALLGEERIHQ